MNKVKLQTPKGFRDFLPPDAIKREVVLGKITSVFQKFGFDPLETPTLEYADMLKGKYGEEEKLIYEFKTKGGDEVALRYDQTVPLARVVAQYGPTWAQKLPIPFKRYQLQSNFRGENPQKGRYREFTQADADIVGVSTSLADAEILCLVYEIYQALNLEIFIKVNDRTLFENIEPKYLAAIDKLSKIGEEKVLLELEQKGLSKSDAATTLNTIKSLKPSKNLTQIIKTYEKMGYPKKSLIVDSTMVRGLDYYTGLIFEVVLKDYPDGSVLGAGGRYDKMVGMFSSVDLPAVGFAIGLDRTIEALEEAGKLENKPTETKVLVTVFSLELLEKSLEVTSRLRSKNIPTEIWLDPDSKLDKQLKYADLKGIPYAVIIGPDEISSGKVTVKNLSQKTQKRFPLDNLIEELVNP